MSLTRKTRSNGLNQSMIDDDANVKSGSGLSGAGQTTSDRQLFETGQGEMKVSVENKWKELLSEQKSVHKESLDAMRQVSTEWKLKYHDSKRELEAVKKDVDAKALKLINLNQELILKNEEYKGQKTELEDAKTKVEELKESLSKEQQKIIDLKTKLVAKDEEKKLLERELKEKYESSLINERLTWQGKLEKTVPKSEFNDLVDANDTLTAEIDTITAKCRELEKKCENVMAAKKMVEKSKLELIREKNRDQHFFIESLKKHNIESSSSSGFARHQSSVRKTAWDRGNNSHEEEVAGYRTVKPEYKKFRRYQ